MLLLSASFLLRAGEGQQLLARLSAAPLDASECYRVRDLQLQRDEAQLFLTDGYLIFAKAAGATPAAAFFSAEGEGGDAELLLLPPLRNERRALSAHTGAPNLDEHFTQAALVFTADTYQELLREMQRNGAPKKSPEMGALLAGRWSPLMQTLGASFGLRLATDFLSSGSARKGFFAAAMNGTKLGAFNLVFDPRVPEQILLGSTTEKTFTVWSSFTSRSFRSRPFTPEFDIADYRIRATLDPELSLHASTTMTVRPVFGEAALPFEISERMRVTGASVNGAPAEILFPDAPAAGESGDGTIGVNNVFLVLPRTPVRAGEPVEVTIEHQGKVIQDAGNSVYSVGARGSWYPTRGRQFTRFDLSFRVPKQLDLVAAGDLVEDREDQDQRVTHWQTSVPIRLAGFNLGVYDRVRSAQGSLLIEVCANRSAEAGLLPGPRAAPVPLPPVFTSRGGLHRGAPAEVFTPQIPATPRMRLQALAAEIGGAMNFFTARFGPLALKRLEVTPVPGRFGQGFPGLIYLSTLSYVDPREGALAGLGEQQKTFFADLLHAHEAAHQWWGNIVTSAAYHDDWLMEALANYSALLYLESRKGPKAVDAVLEEYRLKLLEKTGEGGTLESTGPITEGTRLESAWVPIVYGKGTWILHMLRRQMGDDAFLRMLAALRKEYEDKAIGTEEFRVFCVQFLPPQSPDAKLEGFFDAWVYGTGIPSFKLVSSVKGSPGKWRIAGSLTQAGAGEDFAVPVPLEAQMTAKGRPATRVVFSGAGLSEFEWTLAQQPSRVAIDFRGILHR